MNIYSVYHLTNSGSLRNLILIKEGFNFVAFFFSPLWFLYNSLFKMLIIYLISIISIFQFAQLNFIGLNQTYCLILILHIFVGCFGNDFLSRKLKYQKYELLYNILGRDKDEALLRLLDKYDFNL